MRCNLFRRPYIPLLSTKQNGYIVTECMYPAGIKKNNFSVEQIKVSVTDFIPQISQVYCSSA